MTTSTRTHARCGVDHCTNPTRGDLIATHGGCWHLVEGFVYVEARRAFVCMSWAEACDEHRESVAAAVRADVDGWRERWNVRVRALDYAEPGTGSVAEYAQGLGTDDTRLF